MTGWAIRATSSCIPAVLDDGVGIPGRAVPVGIVRSLDCVTIARRLEWQAGA